MTRRSKSAHPRRLSASNPPKSRTSGAKSPRMRRRAVRNRPAPRARARIVLSRARRLRRPSRPLPRPEAMSERMFLGSLDRSLRDYRAVWEALAKR
jgi:hypothetical protein